MRLRLMIVASLWFSAQFGHADDLNFSAATVYKLGVRTSNGGAAIGSAVLVAPGQVATSCHTTRQAVEIFVLHREGQLRAQPRRSDLRHDLCILSVPELRGWTAERISSDQLKVGQKVTALGYGMSYRLSSGEGEVTALYPYDSGYVVRTSAFFPRGASGGGLFDERGHLVGVLTFRASIDEELNYAVPIEWVDKLLHVDEATNAQQSSPLAFWEDDAADPPVFLRAAWLEYGQSWNELEGLAIDWAINEPENAEAWLALGRAKLGLGMHREGVLALRRAGALGPDNARALYWLALAYQWIGLQEQYNQASTRLSQLDARLAGRLTNPVRTPSE